MIGVSEDFTWTNCQADINKYANNRTISYYLSQVIDPAISSIDSKIEEYEAQGGAYAAFGVSDLQSVMRETLIAFSLAIQSLWERQFRSYLHQVATELRPDDNSAERSKKPNWVDLEKLFEELRGIELKRFKSYNVLNVLHHLGNTARHGDGKSLKHLRDKNPEFFPLNRENNLPFFPPTKEFTQFKNEAPLEVTQIQLRDFALAICAFWDEVELIRLRSLKTHDTRISEAIENLITGLDAYSSRQQLMATATHQN